MSQPVARLRARQAEVLAGAVAPLGARAFDLPMLLEEQRDRVVSKDEILAKVWPGLVVEENNLSVQISALRRALGVQVITTVTGRGYRFTARPSSYVTPVCSDRLPPAIFRCDLGRSLAARWSCYSCWTHTRTWPA